MITSHAQQPKPVTARAKEASSVGERATNQADAGGTEAVDTAKGGPSIIAVRWAVKFMWYGLVQDMWRSNAYYACLDAAEKRLS
jgi:hypothetical protein